LHKLSLETLPTILENSNLVHTELPPLLLLDKTKFLISWSPTSKVYSCSINNANVATMASAIRSAQLKAIASCTLLCLEDHYPSSPRSRLGVSCNNLSPAPTINFNQL